MKKKAIERVASLAKNRESKAARNLADTIFVHKQASNKCDQIKGYRAEYEAHFDGLTKAGVDARTLSEYRQFLNNLDAAVDQQVAVVKTTEERVGESRSEWLNRYHRKSALEQLVEIQQRDQRAALEKRQQKEQDELSSANKSRGC